MKEVLKCFFVAIRLREEREEGASEWHEIINSKKLSGKLFKSHCMGIW
jgi:hypothetical protein